METTLTFDSLLQEFRVLLEQIVQVTQEREELRRERDAALNDLLRQKGHNEYLFQELDKALRERDAARHVIAAAINLTNGGFNLLDTRGMIVISRQEYQELEQAVEDYRRAAQDEQHE